MTDHSPVPMRPSCYSILLATALALVMAAAHSTLNSAQAQTASKRDVLIFINGDQLTGKVVSETAGNVVFQSDMAGASITVPWSKIKELNSSKSFAVIKNDRKLRAGKQPNVPLEP